MAVRAKESQLGKFGRFAGLQGVYGLGMVDVYDAVAYRAVCLGEIEATCFALQAPVLLQYIFFLGLD